MKQSNRLPSILGRLLLSAVIILLLFYTMLPALNPRSQDFFIFLILCILIFLTANFITGVREFLSGLGNSGLRMERDPYTGRVLFHMEKIIPGAHVHCPPWGNPFDTVSAPLP